MKNILCSQMCRIILNIAVPVVTILMTIIAFRNELAICNYLILYLLPVFLVIWFISIVIGISRTVYQSRKKCLSEKQKILEILFLSASFAGFSICTFMEMFARSILLGGFHAS